MKVLGTTRKSLGAGAGLLAGVALAAALMRRPALPSVITVGVDHTPPFYLVEPDGSVRGLAVDVLNEAARRRGIRLLWKPLRDIPLDDALDRRMAQIWPLVGETEARRKRFFLTKPWLESDYILVSLRSRPVRSPAEAAGSVVAHARLRFTALVASRYLAASRLTVKLLREEAVQSVCKGEAVAALVESRVLDAILLARPAGCESAAFNIAAIPGASTPLAIISVPETARAARALRDEITALTRTGFLSAKLDEWSPFSAEGTRSVWAEEQAENRSVVYEVLSATIAVLALILGLLAVRAHRLRLIAERAQRSERETQRRFTAFMENSPAIAFMKDTAGRILYANSAWARILGRAPRDWQGKDEFALFPPAVAARLRDADRATLAAGRAQTIVEQVPAGNAQIREMLVVKFPFADEKGTQFVGGMAIDITERESALRALSASEARYRELFEQNPLPAWVYDRATLAFLDVNRAAVRRYGWSREDFIGGLVLADLLAPNETASQSGRAAYRHRTRDGDILSVDVTSYELQYGNASARLEIVFDTTERDRALERLRVSEERWQLALHGAGDALWDWDLVAGKVFRSPRWFAMLGYGDNEIGASVEEFARLVHPEDLGRLDAAVLDHLKRRTPQISVEYRLLHKDGSWRWIMARGQAIWDETGRATRIAGSYSDVTDRKAAEGLLAAQARTDSLTGLANRREFDRLFELRVAEARESGATLSVCACDLDRFKRVNDTYGHAAGDQVLAAFGEILRQELRGEDLVARLGGDEFAMAFSGTAEEARGLVENVRMKLEERHFEARGEAFAVSCSFGIVQMRAWHRNARELLADADRHLYDAKENGRNRTQVAA